MKRKRRNKQRKLLIITSISFLFIMTVGYGAFQTNLNITAKGNIKKSPTAADQLIETVVTTGDGLYLDTYESDENKKRYVYKGANPNNYITFNNETWRILAVETDETLKIMRKDNIGKNAWDSSNSNNWARPATLNTYLNNSYYNTLNSEEQTLIQVHTWGIGGVTYYNTDLAAQIHSENVTTWDGNIGLISVSDIIRANTNTEQCGNISLNNSNYRICKTTNYIIPVSGFLCTISPNADRTDDAYAINASTGEISGYYTNYNGLEVWPSLYLKSDIYLDGEGTESNPYTINFSN